jgi:hypothetical protein
VDKRGGRECQELIKTPTRDNYNRWLKKEGLRPLESGELNREKRDDWEKHVRESAGELAKRHQERCRIEVR